MGNFFKAKDDDGTEQNINISKIMYTLYDDTERDHEILEIHLDNHNHNRGHTFFEYKGRNAVAMYKALLPLLTIILVAIWLFH